ncbi:MAG: glycosyltransferase [Bacilli bacterium]|jgi:lipopolysaccharide biosynthesis glycosyltransferase|nr:glycosyltransferase [Bacilli bacterium]MDD3389204.1 glycosyltransferase [Bacilli bacterium]MDD4344954.1 glycosyltransferase [Bacilli bacterium]MDD4521235.1 glycosyltransferase [Bacilli bacterium]MDY0399812.1 glycosyltransferase [Bacilli bacterium]
MNIVYAGNKKVFDGLLISVLSIIENTSAQIDFFVLTLDLLDLDGDYIGISEEEIDVIRQEIVKVNPKNTIQRLDVTNEFNQYLRNSKNLINRYTPYALLRLLIDCRKEIPGKALYLDVDTVINRNIEQLYHLDITKYEFAACRDRYGRFFFNPNYCNTGVLLLNVEKIRETNLFKKVIALLEKKEVFLSDQTGINKMAKRKKVLPRRFNEQKKVRKDTVIRHFSMQFRIFPKFHFVNIKPWNIEQVHNVYHCHEFDHILAKYSKIMQTRSK